jgi:hypothetical protein
MELEEKLEQFSWVSFWALELAHRYELELFSFSHDCHDCHFSATAI